MRHFPNWIEAYLEHVKKSEPSTRYKKWCAASAIASVLKRKCYLEWHDRIYPNMYVVLVGPSGGRKGTAMSPIASILSELNITMAAEAITREALIRELKHSTDSVVRPDGVETHSSLTIFSQELAVFLGKDNLQLLSDLTDWYDCRSKWSYRTKTQGTDDIVGVWVNLIGATTPSILQNSLPQDAIGGGLTSRIIFVYAKGKERLDPAPFLVPKDIETRNKLVEDLADIMTLQGCFKLTMEALEYWLTWYPDHEKNPPFNDEKFGGYCERKPTHMLKLSMILNASRSTEMTIDVCDMQAASDMLRETEEHMPNVFAGYGRRDCSDLIPVITNLILARKRILRSELIQRFLTDLSVSELDEIISALCGMNMCRLSIDPTNGQQWIECLKS